MSRQLRWALGGILLVAAGAHLATRYLETRDPRATPALAREDRTPGQAFRSRLRRQGELELSPREVAELGRTFRHRVEDRMDHLAGQIRPGADDWRPLFADLAREHPRTEEEVLALYRQELDRARAFAAGLDLVPLPEAGVEVAPVANPILRRSFPLALYLDSGRLGVVLRPPEADEPNAAYLANHCFVCVPPLAVHEGFPGHHVAYSLAEAPEAGPGSGADRRNMIFQEGWAQYAELLMLEHGYWAGDGARELGALRLLLLRALRAEIDGLLAAGTLTPAAARERYVDLLRATPAAAAAEVVGHREAPGRKSAYLLGALQILALRRELTDEGNGVGLRDFHATLLRRPRPIPAIARESFGRGGLPPLTTELVPLGSEAVAEGGAGGAG